MITRPIVLFVDDESPVLNGLRRALRRCEAKWDMRFESNPHTALAMAREHPPNVVITDLAMPDMDGASLIAAMRPSAPRARYLVLSGTADFGDAVAAINQARVFRLLIKPCDTATLRDAIDDALADQRQGPDPAHVSNALAALGEAVLVVRQDDLHIAFANAQGEAFLRARDGILRDERGCLRALALSDTKQMHDHARAVSQRTMAHMRLARRAGLGDILVSICPAEEDNMVTLILCDPDARRTPGAAALEELFALSAKEALIVDVLCRGGDLDEAAEEAGLTISSVRTYLKRIFGKTGTSRQTDLVRLALSAPSAMGTSADLSR